MVFKEALELMKQGKKVKLPHWKGYWVKEDNSIKMYCKNGEVLDIRETEDVFYTLSNIVSDEWEVVDDDYEVNKIITTMTFGEAIRNLKNGKLVTRIGWNGKGMYIYLSNGYFINVDDVLNKKLCEKLAEETNDGIVAVNKHINMKAVDGSLVIGWLASQADMLAEDWIIVE